MQIDINYDNGLSDIANNIENNFADIIGQGAQTVCESAKSLCPVDTGLLQSSINVQPAGNTAVISSGNGSKCLIEIFQILQNIMYSKDRYFLRFEDKRIEFIIGLSTT